MTRSCLLILTLFLLLSNDRSANAQDCSSLAFDLPLTNPNVVGNFLFPCYTTADPVDISSFVTVAGGTFSGLGISPEGVFNAPDAVPPQGNNFVEHTVEITYTVNIGGVDCTIMQSSTIQVPALATINPIPTVYCTSDSPVGLVGTPEPQTPQSFLINGLTPFGSDEFNPAFYGAGEHEVSYHFIDFASGSSCVSSDTVFVMVYTEEELQDALIVSQQDVPEYNCIDSDPFTLEPFPTGGVLTGPGLTGDVFDPALAGAGEHMVYYEFTTEQGSCTAIDSIQINVQEFTASFDVVNSGCAGEIDSLIYTGTTYDNNFDIEWMLDGAELVESSANNDTVLVLASDPGTYTVDLFITGPIDCLDGMATEDVVKEGLSVSTIEDQIIGLESTEIFLDTEVTSTNPGVFTYDWSPGENLSCTDCEDPTLIASESETYNVTVTDEFGCEASDEVVITVEFSKKIFVPNAFTPNGDGNNDELLIFGQGIDRVEFSLFDRWGERVFYTNDPSQGWNGDLGGEPMNAAVFYYYLEATFVDGATERSKGDVTLIR